MAFHSDFGRNSFLVKLNGKQIVDSIRQSPARVTKNIHKTGKSLGDLYISLDFSILFYLQSNYVTLPRNK